MSRTSRARRIAGEPEGSRHQEARARALRPGPQRGGRASSGRRCCSPRRRRGASSARRWRWRWRWPRRRGAGDGFEQEVGEGVLPGLRELFDGRDGLGEFRGHGSMIALRGGGSIGCGGGCEHPPYSLIAGAGAGARGGARHAQRAGVRTGGGAGGGGLGVNRCLGEPLTIGVPDNADLPMPTIFLYDGYR